jgi:hypothetical protein
MMNAERRKWACVLRLCSFCILTSAFRRELVMSGIIVSASGVLPVPTPRVPIAIRPGVLSDVPFMDSLQRMHTKMVGFMPTAQFEGNIKQGRVLIAEEVPEDVKREDVTGAESSHVFTSSATCPRWLLHRRGSLFQAG